MNNINANFFIFLPFPFEVYVIQFTITDSLTVGGGKSDANAPLRSVRVRLCNKALRSIVFSLSLFVGTQTPVIFFSYKGDSKE